MTSAIVSKQDRYYVTIVSDTFVDVYYFRDFVNDCFLSRFLLYFTWCCFHQQNITEMNRKSDVWSFFSVSKSNDQKALCNICHCLVSRGGKDTRSYTTTNLKRHMERSHPSVHNKLLKLDVPQASASPSSSECRPTMASSSKIVHTEDISCRKDSSKQEDISEMFKRNIPYPPTHKRATEITSLIANMICTDFLPFSIVDSEGKKHFNLGLTC